MNTKEYFQSARARGDVSHFNSSLSIWPIFLPTPLLRHIWLIYMLERKGSPSD